MNGTANIFGMYALEVTGMRSKEKAPEGDSGVFLGVPCMSNELGGASSLWGSVVTNH